MRESDRDMRVWVDGWVTVTVLLGVRRVLGQDGAGAMRETQMNIVGVRR